MHSARNKFWNVQKSGFFYDIEYVTYFYFIELQHYKYKKII